MIQAFIANPEPTSIQGNTDEDKAELAAIKPPHQRCIEMPESTAILLGDSWLGLAQLYIPK
jgi:hypothetical protein